MSRRLIKGHRQTLDDLIEHGRTSFVQDFGANAVCRDRNLSIASNAGNVHTKQQLNSTKRSSAMRRWTKVILISSIPFLCFFGFGITDFGHSVLMGRIPAHINHWKADDIDMGAALAPVVYGLVPFIVLCSCALISWCIDLQNSLKRRGLQNY
jgi:hypothetical protein